MLANIYSICFQHLVYVGDNDVYITASCRICQQLFSFFRNILFLSHACVDTVLFSPCAKCPIPLASAFQQILPWELKLPTGRKIIVISLFAKDGPLCLYGKAVLQAQKVVSTYGVVTQHDYSPHISSSFSIHIDNMSAMEYIMYVSGGYASAEPESESLGSAFGPGRTFS